MKYDNHILLEGKMEFKNGIFFLGMAAFVLPSTTAIKDKLNKKNLQ